MIKYDRPSNLTAFQAISDAQKLAFSPIAFQASLALLRLGVLKAVAETGERGADAAEISAALRLREYGVRVLLDMGLSVGLVWMRDERYVLDKVGYFVLNDEMTQTNMNFVADVCYEAMYCLQESVEHGAPRGLKRFGDWPTIYPGLSLLSEPARTSWFRFDHFYSTNAQRAALDLVLATRPRRVLDIGGNAGLWAEACAERDAAVRITIIDLPEQIAMARRKLEGSPNGERISYHAIDLLDPEQALPAGADTIWMSQFLDCFAEEQVEVILQRAADSIEMGGSVFVLELLSDRQRHDAAAYSVNATSLYFTCLANGVSRMYRSDDLLRLVRRAGLHVQAQHDNLGLGHTLVHCVKRG
jgi:2-polyprenyl-3-methyl-5-hydroxy-6-metoxy-1,4-benzoquinol methylase